jgi:hypothetical protein
MSPRRKRYPAAIPGNVMRIICDSPEGTDLSELREAVRNARLPKDKNEIRRLSDTCRRCGDEGHWAKDGPLEPCWVCGEPGHRRNRCPQREAT